MSEHALNIVFKRHIFFLDNLHFSIKTLLLLYLLSVFIQTDMIKQRRPRSDLGLHPDQIWVYTVCYFVSLFYIPQWDKNGLIKS